MKVLNKSLRVSKTKTLWVRILNLILLGYLFSALVPNFVYWQTHSLWCLAVLITRAKIREWGVELSKYYFVQNWVGDYFPIYVWVNINITNCPSSQNMVHWMDAKSIVGSYLPASAFFLEGLKFKAFALPIISRFPSYSF